MNFDMKAQPFFGSDTSCEGWNLILLSLFASQDLKCRLVYVIDAWVWFAYTMSWFVLPPSGRELCQNRLSLHLFSSLIFSRRLITYWLYFPKFLNNIIFLLFNFKAVIWFFLLSYPPLLYLPPSHFMRQVSKYKIQLWCWDRRSQSDGSWKIWASSITWSSY